MKLHQELVTQIVQWPDLLYEENQSSNAPFSICNNKIINIKKKKISYSLLTIIIAYLLFYLFIIIYITRLHPPFSTQPNRGKSRNPI